MTSVRQLLGGHARVFAIAPEASVHEALRLMAEKDVSALAVLEGCCLVGIVTERDVARKALRGDPVEQLSVRQIMTCEVIAVSPSETLDTCMALMIDHHVRHLPVVDGDRIVGMLSMRDLVRHVLAEKDFVIRQMSDYISGAHASAHAG